MSTSGIVRALRKAIDDDPSVEQVFFFDDDFSLRTKKELGEFVRAYQAQVGLPFYIFAYPNTTTDEKLDLYQEVGLKNVEFGLQTVSRRVLRKYHRAQNAEHLRRILKRSTEKAYAFTIAFDIITNSPFDTEEDVVQNIRYILSLPGSFELHVHSLHLFPGSPLRIEYGGGTGNEFHEYQDNFSAHAVRYFNEFYTKILFAMQGWHEANEPTYGTLTRREILVMLRSPTNKRVELLAMLDARMAETRVGLFYNELHHV
jgi:coproporphyrinogen III oxidase-like Fe-S oxidoreductase